MFDAMYVHSAAGEILLPSAIIDDRIVQCTRVSFLGQNAFPTEEWSIGAPTSHVQPPSTELNTSVSCVSQAGRGLKNTQQQEAETAPLLLGTGGDQG